MILSDLEKGCSFYTDKNIKNRADSVRKNANKTHFIYTHTSMS